MATNIVIVDYAMGNLKSVSKAFESVGQKVQVSSDAKVIAKADKIILPGVGSFGHCIQELKKLNLSDVVKEHVKSQKLFLGICLGMQLLFDGSAEAEGESGLSLIPGSVLPFKQDQFLDGESCKIPHMGWNEIEFTKSDNPLFKGIDDKAHFYFVHSYYVKPQDDSVVAATCDYGEKFCASVWQDNVFACQFHPEKSQANGLKLMKNFVDL